MLNVQHKDGIWWYDAPMPPEQHDCEPWSSGESGSFFVERCACGATKLDHDWAWLDINSRRETSQ